jgi:NodT family efflux transporter outer membrane factor (OMF) lipoprotein
MCTSAASSAAVGQRPPRAAALASLAALLLAACGAGPDFVRPSPPAQGGYLPGAAPAATVTADGRAQGFTSGAAVPADWWHLFGSADLDRLVNEALAHNETLASAGASLRQSEDALRAGYGVYLPQVSADLGATRQRASPLRLGQNGPSGIFNLFTLSGSVGYLLDVFGGARREVEALHAAVDVERNVALATYLALTANVVNTSIASAAYRAEIAATRASIEAAAAQLTLAEAQFAGGTAPYANVLSLRAQLAALQASLPPLELRAEQADHLLAVLAGHAPADWAAPALALEDFVLPESLPLSLPSALVRQRPDILAAEARLHRASAQIGVATAALLPTLTLSGSLGNDASRWPQLRDASGRFWSAGGDLSVPVFQGGKAWYGRKAALGAYQAALADYRQAVLSAFQQVADTLRALDHDAELVRAESESQAAARDSLKLTQVNYEAGVAGYLAVLTATSQYQAAEIGYLAARSQRLQDTVALFVALGGGWWAAAATVPALAPIAAGGTR